MKYPKGLLKSARKYWAQWYPGWVKKGIVGTPNEIYCLTFCNLAANYRRMVELQERGDHDLGIEPGALIQINVSVDGAGVEHRHPKFHQVLKGQNDLTSQMRQLNKYVGIDDTTQHEPNPFEELIPA